MKSRLEGFRTKPAATPIQQLEGHQQQQRQPKMGRTKLPTHAGPQRHGYHTRSNSRTSGSNEDFLCQEEIDTNSEPEGVKREESLEDLYSRTEPGKSSLVSIVANQVTLKETVDSRSKEPLLPTGARAITNQTREHRRRILRRSKHSR
jgi:hypothetical protein